MDERLKPAQESGSDRTHFDQLAQTETTQEFLTRWLNLQCSSIPAARGGLVAVGSGARAEPDTAVWTPPGSGPISDVRKQRLGQAAQAATQQNRSAVTDAGSFGGLYLPSGQAFLLACPIEVGRQVIGAVAVETEGGTLEMLEAALRQIEWGTCWFRLRQTVQAGEQMQQDNARMQAALNGIAAATGQERFLAGAMELVNHLQGAFHCDRVSMSTLKGHRLHVVAISNAAVFDKRTHVVQDIQAAMEEALDQQSLVVFPQPKDAPAAQLRRVHAHGQLSQKHGPMSICSVPLRRLDEVTGCLLLERPADKPFDGATADLLESIGDLVGPVVEVQRLEDRPLWRKTGSSFRWAAVRLFGPGHPLAKLVVLLLVGLAIFFSFARATYRVAADCTLIPTVKHACVAPFNGVIHKAFFKAGDPVSKGDLLCSLKDDELRNERGQLQARKEQERREFVRAKGEMKTAEAGIIEARIQQIDVRLERIEEKLRQTQIRAPIDGMVMQGDLTDRLGAKVPTGEVLFVVAPRETGLRVVIDVDERDIREIRVNQTGELLLESYPGRKFPITISRISPLSNPGEGDNTFRVEARLHEADAQMRPGMEGSTKITIGRRLLIWNWTHKMIDWVRLKLWL